MNDDNKNTDHDKNQKENPQTRGPVNFYDPEQVFAETGNRKGGFSGWKKGFVIFLIIAVVVVGLGVSCNMGVNNLLGATKSESYEFTSDYIGVLKIHGTISEDSDSSSEYNQSWLISRVEEMKNDSYNQGMILSIDTPGGSVYATDELYLKIEEYKEETGRPVYTYMESMAASGGYYIASASEKIYANRNCWTGSIGVTIGTIYDISGFLEDLGVKTVTITSGKNKSMGSSVEPLTDEQKEIYQSLVDEAYEQFVEIVSKGRKMNLSKVKKLADGRVYTAKQALENGLIDQIGTLDDAVNDMQKSYELEACDVQTLSYKAQTSLISLLGGLVSSEKSDVQTEYDQLMELMEENNKFTVTYMSQIKK